MSVIVCLVCESKTYRTNSKLCWCCEPNEPDPDLEICDGAFSAYCIAVPAALAAAQAAGLATAARLRSSTLYTSAEPCAMCAGAIYWCGIGRVVYALSEHQLLGLTGDHPENPTFALPCREVFARGQRRIEVTGPCLEEEAAAAHAGFWQRP